MKIYKWEKSSPFHLVYFALSRLRQVLFALIGDGLDGSCCVCESTIKRRSDPTIGSFSLRKQQPLTVVLVRLDVSSPILFNLPLPGKCSIVY